MLIETGITKNIQNSIRDKEVEYILVPRAFILLLKRLKLET